MSDTQTYKYDGEPKRLDLFLSSKLTPMSRTRVQRLIVSGAVTVNGAAALSRYILSQGDKVDVQMPEFTSLPASSAGDVPIIFEDAHLIVVNKPAGWVVHPAGPHREGTLIQRLWPKLAKNWSTPVASKRRKSKKESVPAADRPGVVHRLDRGTSGVIVIAKTPAAAENLSKQFADRGTKKTYWALVWGQPLNEKGHIRSVVGRSRREPHKMSVTDQGRWSETEFKVLERFPKVGGKGCALLEVTPLTGRTHQIRVQLAALGHPVVGDVIYGEDEPRLADRPLLHALRLELAHPQTRKRVAWKAEPPADFEKFLKEARR